MTKIKDLSELTRKEIIDEQRKLEHEFYNLSHVSFNPRQKEIHNILKNKLSRIEEELDKRLMENR